MIPTIEIVLAIANDGRFGYVDPAEKNYVMPWGHITEDMRNFATLTSGSDKAVFMGYNTFMSLPPKYRPLPNRQNIVLVTRGDITDLQKKYPEVIFVTSIQSFFAYLQTVNFKNVYIIGGIKTIKAFLDPVNTHYFFIDGMYVTNISTNSLMLGPETMSEFVNFPEMLDICKSWPHLSAREDHTKTVGLTDKDSVVDATVHYFKIR